MTTDGSQQNHIEFLECVTMVTFTKVVRVVADWMWDFDLFVNFVNQILSLGIFLDALDIFLLIQRYPDHNLIFSLHCC